MPSKDPVKKKESNSKYYQKIKKNRRSMLQNTTKKIEKKGKNNLKNQQKNVTKFINNMHMII
jgi:hypothetical protein